MMRHIARLGLFVLVALTGAPALAAVQVPRTIQILPSAGATSAVQNECGLQTAVPQAIAQAAADVQLVDAPAKSGRWLELSISEVHALGGGPFSGTKWMAVSGKLHDRGKVIGSFRAKRLSTGVRGTCATLAKIATVIGQDVAAWLAAPTMNAELGDAR